ncbi:MAG: cyclodeaminase/cyclohydrolase family protein [Lachnospiraceae bacterium]|nr:cyclodeaminase/cyclohydrolase family protein [Lachnospiraceae bacterium]
MDLSDNFGIKDFLEALAGKDPVPGGGGASALTGALGASLASMTCALTFGKKKYADKEPALREADAKLRENASLLFEGIDRDAKAFLPLAEAFSLPSGTPEEAAHKDEVLQKEYLAACDVPMAVMKSCLEGIEAAAVAGTDGSKVVISDACAGLILLEAAMKAAALNVYINARYMKDRTKAEELVRFAEETCDKGSKLAGEVISVITEELKTPKV